EPVQVGEMLPNPIVLQEWERLIETAGGLDLIELFRFELQARRVTVAAVQTRGVIKARARFRGRRRTEAGPAALSPIRRPQPDAVAMTPQLPDFGQMFFQVMPADPFGGARPLARPN